MLKLQISDFLVILASSLWIIYLAIAYFVLHYPLSEILSSVYGALALGGFLGALVFVSREKWMGAGDIGLGAILGALTGWPNVLVAGFSAFILGGLVGVVLMATKKKEMQSQVPFAPFLILGFYIALFWGDRILYWYLKGFM
jgi:leader peptidase (prepilin peptidase)/N-methyltransferase